MSWLDAIKGRAQEAKAKAPEAKASEARAAKPRAKREIKVTWFQTAAPRNGDAGSVEAVHYFVADGAVTVMLCDKEGKSTKRTAILADGDEPARIAARMARAAWAASRSDFDRRLTYGPLGLA